MQLVEAVVVYQNVDDQLIQVMLQSKMFRMEGLSLSTVNQSNPKSCPNLNLNSNIFKCSIILTDSSKRMSCL